MFGGVADGGRGTTFGELKMQMEVQDVADVTRIILEGKLDFKGVDQIETRFTAIASSRAKVAVDLSAVDYIASLGIRILVMSGKAANNRGHRIVLFGAQESVSKVITTCGLDEIVPLVPDFDAACAALA